MLARRLLILAAVLLVTGAVAAALTPRELREGDAPTAPVPASPGGARPAAPEVTRTLDASRPGRPVVRVRRGTLLRLRVSARAPDVVELRGLGRASAVDEFTAARFEFFALQEGSFPIRLRIADREIGRLVIAPPAGGAAAAG